jgi:hypothetical protein
LPLLFSLKADTEFEIPDKKLIHPDFLFVHAWEYQAILTNLQADINSAIQEVQTAVSNVLKTSTSQTLTQYETHVNDVQAEYEPHLEQFQTLKPGDCRNDAEGILNRTASSTGYRASNCAAAYDNRVQNEVAIANRAFVRFDDLFSQVQSIVVKSFIGSNQFLTPEDIQDKITEIYELVNGKWAGSKPEIEAVRRNLASAITAQNIELGNCHQANLNYATMFFGMFREAVQICIDFDNTPNPFASKRLSMNSTPYGKKRAEFEAAFDSQKDFEWQA